MKLESLPAFIVPKDKINVEVAICTHNQSVHVQLLNWALAVTHLSYSKGCPWFFQFNVINGFKPIPFARNVLVGHFLRNETKPAILWYIDSDMIPELTLFKVLQVDAEIACGRMFGWSDFNNVAGRPGGPFLCAYTKNELGGFDSIPAEKIPQGKVVECAAIGTGSMAIKREVLKNPRMYLDDKFTMHGQEFRHRDFKDEPNWAPPIFRETHKPNGERMRGSDIDFCDRARAIGYRVAMHTGAEIAHRKTVIVDDIYRLAAAQLEIGARLARQGDVYGYPDEEAK